MIIDGEVMLDEGRFVGRDPEALRGQLIASMGSASRTESSSVGQLKQVVRDVLKSYDQEPS